VDRPFTVESEREYLESMSDRETVFVADTLSGVVGFQTLDLWTKLHGSMDHVGQLGTFVLSPWRTRGVATQLAQATMTFAGEHRYEKLVVFVRGSNSAAQAFYRSIGFTPCGRLTRHVLIDGHYDDEVVMERWL
jgi:RimJ/RimL family protein N-acetyltransferase